jgi:hypothetical protein
MLPVILFILLWVVLGLGLFFVAMRGRRGPGAPVPGPSTGQRRAAGLAYLFTYVVFGVALPLVFLTGNHRNANAQVGARAVRPALRRLPHARRRQCRRSGRTESRSDSALDIACSAHDPERLPAEPATLAVKPDVPWLRDDARKHPPGEPGERRRAVRRARRGQGIARSERDQTGGSGGETSSVRRRW